MKPWNAVAVGACVRRLRHAVGAAASLLLVSGPAAAGTIFLTSGTTGPLVPGQSFNETRGIDVTVISAWDLQVSTLTLRKFFMGSATSAFIGARIYESGSGQLIAAGDTTIAVAPGVIPVPITATLVSGASYRVAFFVATTPAGQGTATLFDPDPAGAGGFPYTEPTGQLRINGTFQAVGDVFPDIAVVAEPHASMQVFPASLDLTSGTSGVLTAPQAFDGTRGVDVTVMGASNVQVASLGLEGLDIGSASSALVGARIYETSGGSLVAAADATITSAGGPLSVPISATLSAGSAYRVAFFVATTPPGQGTGTLFDPAPAGPGGFPWTETGGVLQVNGAYSAASDAFPSGVENVAPQIQVNTTIGQWTDLGHPLAGAAGLPHLVGTGTLVPGTSVTMQVSRLLANGVATLVIGLSAIQAPFKGGVMVPALDALVPGLPAGPDGVLSLVSAWPAGLPGGFTFILQCWQKDPAGVAGFSASNGLGGTTP